MYSIEKLSYMKAYSDSSDSDNPRFNIKNKKPYYNNKTNNNNLSNNKIYPTNNPILFYILQYSKKLLQEENKSKPSRQGEQLLKELNNIISTIKQNKIKNISNLQLESLNKNISSSLSSLRTEVISIYFTSRIKNTFYNIRQLSYDQKLSTYLQSQLNSITKGNELQKLHFTSNGAKNHYYQLDLKHNTLQVKNKTKSDYIMDEYNLEEHIFKITYGISSNNLKQKLMYYEEELMNGSKWTYFSIWILSRTIDLNVNCSELYEYEEDNNNYNKIRNKKENNNLIKNWFYGLKHFYNCKGIYYKTPSSTKFLLNKLKLQIVDSLQTNLFSQTKMKKNTKQINLVNSIIKEKGIQKLSFIKIFLFIMKYNN